MNQGGVWRRSCDAVHAVWLAENERVVLWLPVWLGTGAAAYFALPQDVPLVASLSAALGLAGLSVAARRYAALWVPLAVLGLVATGMVLGAVRVQLVDAPVLSRLLRNAQVTGTVQGADRSGEGYRAWLEDVAVEGMSPAHTPARLRLNMTQVPPPAGARVRLRAVLVPPPGPSLPGDYDFARAAYFDQIGAVGTVLGEVEMLTQPLPGLVPTTLESMRETLRSGLEATLGAREAGVAVALLTGERGGIADDDRRAIARAGLAHLLAISGLHVSMAAGLAFVALRFLLALSERAALRLPVHKVAAGCGMLLAIGYTLLVDAPVPATRACISCVLVLGAVMVDRVAISMRLVAWAALAVLVVAPEAVSGPSFQMSFGAVVALVAAYEALGQRLRDWQSRSGPISAVLGYCLGLAMTSLVAGLATAPFTQFHFNQMVAYGLAANMIGVPLFGLCIMPMGLLGVLLFPLGLQALAWVPMGWGLSALLAVAHTVADWPGAAVSLSAPPIWGVALASFGGLWLCVWTQPWRWLGVAGIVIGMASTALTPRADLIVADSGGLWAVRLPDGTLAFSTLRGGGFDRGRWQQREGVDGITALDLGQMAAQLPGAACDAQACRWPTPAGTVQVIIDPAAALAPEACADTVFVVAPRSELGPTCSAPVRIDRATLRQSGAALVYWRNGQLTQLTVADWRGRRPWSGGSRQ
jgi:competence protein ComEC